ncbi:uncharacterized protein LOC122534336 [Frieseomelitta varia]|uniref:uncharacterized protein LOC122534336 n=1 Tax=Frieseomelitta varia TaxID=561572 RepID=UPI001CB69442|nr:uncharacterized protein LOC122534336 [Frieseomelitta varia]
MSVRTYVGLITPAVSRHTTLTRGQVTGIYTGRPASNCSYSWLMHRTTHLETHTQTATPKLALETPSVALQSTRTHSRRRIMMLPTSTDSIRQFRPGDTPCKVFYHDNTPFQLEGFTCTLALARTRIDSIDILDR